MPTQCGTSRYTGATNPADYATGARASAGCLWNTQSLLNRTTQRRAAARCSATYQTERPTWEAKSDGTYFLTNKLGGDHSLKFGLGWRKAPIVTFSHYSGGAPRPGAVRRQHQRELRQRQLASRSAPRPASCPTRPTIYRDQLQNNDWWTYNGYIQDSYSRGRMRLNGGLRYDWQQSKHLGGCVPANTLRPEPAAGAVRERDR